MFHIRIRPGAYRNHHRNRDRSIRRGCAERNRNRSEQIYRSHPKRSGEFGRVVPLRLCRSGITKCAPRLPAFKQLHRDATVQAGGTTTVSLPMTLAESKSVVTVEAATAQINYDSHAVQGVIQQSNITDLPLNGR
jgi:hypothetical protein